MRGRPQPPALQIRAGRQNLIPFFHGLLCAQLDTPHISVVRRGRRRRRRIAQKVPPFPLNSSAFPTPPPNLRSIVSPIRRTPVGCPPTTGTRSRRRNVFLLFSSDRTGSPQAFRMDLKTGQSRQLTSAEELDSSSLHHAARRARLLLFRWPVAARDELLDSARSRDIPRAGRLAAHRGGRRIERRLARGFRRDRRTPPAALRLVSVARGTAETVTEAGWTHHAIRSRIRGAPRFSTGKATKRCGWSIPMASQNHKLKLADGHIGPARWSPDGRTVIYLHFPDDTTQLHAHARARARSEPGQDGRQDQPVRAFRMQLNGSVFVGASQNKASPYILLLLRVTRRELTMCEHHAERSAHWSRLSFRRTASASTSRATATASPPSTWCASRSSLRKRTRSHRVKEMRISRFCLLAAVLVSMLCSQTDADRKRLQEIQARHDRGEQISQEDMQWARAMMAKVNQGSKRDRAKGSSRSIRRRTPRAWCRCPIWAAGSIKARKAGCIPAV